LWLNQIGGRPTADPRVRKALVQALDLGEVIKVNTEGNGEPATGLVESQPKPCPGNTVTGLLPPHDVAAAGGLLDQSGWIKGSDGVRRKGGRQFALNLHYWPEVSPLNKPTVELLKQRWEPLGIHVQLVADNLAGFNKVMYQTSDYDVYMMGFGLSMPTQAVSYLSGPLPPKGQNVSGVHNKDYDALVAKAQTLVPPAACAYWNQAEQAIWRDLDLVPIAGKKEQWFLKNTQPQITGWNLPIPTSIRVFR
jgi:peptide/nickel transport system substrate-binding protein